MSVWADMSSGLCADDKVQSECDSEPSRGSSDSVLIAASAQSVCLVTVSGAFMSNFLQLTFGQVFIFT